MRRTYSLYEAKTHLSEIIRQVRERGVGVTISYHGKAVAEIRPIEEPGGDALDARIRDMVDQGVIVPATARFGIKPIARRAGGLDRFLGERA